MESLSSLSTFVIQYFSFPLVFSFIIFHSFIFCITYLFLCLFHACGHYTSQFCNLVIAFFISVWLVFRPFISAVRDFLVSSVLFSSPASILMIVVLFHFILIFNVYLFLREREWAEEGQRERGRQNLKQILARGRTHKLWDHDLSLSWTLKQLSHSGAPWLLF